MRFMAQNDDTNPGLHRGIEIKWARKLQARFLPSERESWFTNETEGSLQGLNMFSRDHEAVPQEEWLISNRI